MTTPRHILARLVRASASAVPCIPSLSRGFLPRFGFLLICFVLSAPLSVHADRKNAIQGLRLPLLGMDRGKPAANVQIGSMHMGSQRRGVFRIGLLPLAVCEDVTITFLTPDPAAFDDFPKTFVVMAKTSVLEIRNLEVRLSGGDAPLFKAGSAQVASGKAWELSNVTLSDGTWIQSAHLEVSEGKASLRSADKNHQFETIPLFKK